MLNIFYLGNNTGIIAGMPGEYIVANGKLTDEQKESINKRFAEFDVDLQSPDNLKYKYLCAVTANYTQTRSGELLKKNGFRAVKTFYSSHVSYLPTNSKETLTLWTKTQNNYIVSDLTAKPIIKNSLNCSIFVNNKESVYRCSIIVESIENTKEELKKLGYLRIKNTPIWFKIDPKWIIQE